MILGIGEMFVYMLFTMRLFPNTLITIKNTPNSPKAEIKNEAVATARRQTNTETPSAVQC